MKVFINHKRFREEIKQEFWKHRKTYKQVAEDLGYSENTISAYMCSANNSDNVARSLAKYFNKNIFDYEEADLSPYWGKK